MEISDRTNRTELNRTLNRVGGAGQRVVEQSSTGSTVRATSTALTRRVAVGMRSGFQGPSVDAGLDLRVDARAQEIRGSSLDSSTPWPQALRDFGKLEERRVASQRRGFFRRQEVLCSRDSRTTMIDRERRVIAAHIASEFQHGAISITTLDARWPLAGTDDALIAIHATLLLAFYDEDGSMQHALGGGKGRLLERCIAYLRSEESYSAGVGVDGEHQNSTSDVSPEHRFSAESTWPFPRGA